MTANFDALRSGGHVVVIGGGPGGTACALALKRIADEISSPIKITILESKQFLNERHYNQCVGVLSPPLPELLEERLYIPFPRELCLVDIDGYILHTSGEQITLGGMKDGSVAVRRVQFDGYMLEKVKENGIEVLPIRAVDLEFHTDRVLVYTENEPVYADVVVGAFGLDEGSASMFARLTPYRPPASIDSIVTKYNPNSGCIEEFGTKIYAYLPADPHIEFGAITPKCNHLTINIAGKHVNSDMMLTFLSSPGVRDALPNSDSGQTLDLEALHFYKGRFPSSLARGYYGDRYVMIGDASGLVRAFKGKGSTTAMVTGIRAAETIMTKGISRQVFDEFYREANQDIISDLPYGRAMRQFTIFTSRFGLLDPVLRAAQVSPDLRDALYEAVSGHGYYKDVLKKSLRLDVIGAIVKAIFQKSSQNKD